MSPFVQLIQIRNAFFFQHHDKFFKNFSGSFCIFHCPVMIYQRYFQHFGYIIKCIFGKMREKHTGDPHCIYHCKLCFQILFFAFFLDKRVVKLRVMGYQHTSFTKFQKFRQHRLNGWSIFYHIIGNTCYLCDSWWNRHLGIYKGTEPVCNRTVFCFDSSKLNDAVSCSGKTGSLQVKHNKGSL